MSIFFKCKSQGEKKLQINKTLTNEHTQIIALSSCHSSLKTSFISFLRLTTRQSVNILKLLPNKLRAIYPPLLYCASTYSVNRKLRETNACGSVDTRSVTVNSYILNGI